MTRANVLFAFLAPTVVIGLIAIVVIGFGELLLGVRYAMDDVAHHGQMTEDAARLYPVGIALAVATVFLLGGMLASRLAPQHRSDDIPVGDHSSGHH